MPPDKPPRGRLPSIREENVSRGPHTPIPGPDARPTEPPPQSILKPPPRGYEGPRKPLLGPSDERTLVGVAPPAERRPPPANPPPPESIRPPTPSVETGVVTVARGKWTLSVPSAVVLAALTCAGGAITAWVNKPQADDPTSALKAVRDEMAALRAELTTQNAASVHRLDGLETKVDRLQDSQDRLRERFNERTK